MEIDLADYAGEVTQVRLLLRKPSGTVEKKIGLYVHRLALEAYTPVSIEDCAPYDRSLYRHWIDADRNCRNTRQESLVDSATGEVEFLDQSECTVAFGEWADPYTDFVFDNPIHMDIDHMVPLKEAHESGAWAWDSDTRRDFANQLDPLGQLFAVQASANRKKGAKDPAEWLPPSEDFHVAYAQAWVDVKLQWGLMADGAELAALREILGEDPEGGLPEEAPEVSCRSE